MQLIVLVMDGLGRKQCTLSNESVCRGLKRNESIYRSTGRARELHRIGESLRASNSGVVTQQTSSRERRLDRELP